ncbi:MAG: DUF364 domain-containing protein [Desulfobacterales bacterium]|nr:DUF364 domain-containing protein [Desulfobacterales bacterium]
MKILQDTAALARERLGAEYEILTLDNLVVGLFFTGVKLSNGAGGICYTPVKDIPKAVCCPSSAGRIFNPEEIRGMTVPRVLEGLTSGEPVKTAVAIAVLNALSLSCWEKEGPKGYTLLEKRDAQELVEMPVDKSVAVVGAFVPTLHALKARGGTWWVVEQDPETLMAEEMDHYVPAAESMETIGRADVLVITGVTLINHTLEGILDAAKPGAEIAVMGPTASALPEVLFDRGVRIVGGVKVTDPDPLLQVIAAGGSGYHFLGRYAEMMTAVRD